MSQTLLENMTSACASYHAVLDKKRAEQEEKRKKFHLEQNRVHSSKCKATEKMRSKAKKTRSGHLKSQSVRVVKKKAQ